MATPFRPDGSYEVEMQFRFVGPVTEGNLMLPVGPKSVILVFANANERLNGAANHEQPAFPAFVQGATYRAHVKVSIDGNRAAVEADVNGSPFAKWAGRIDELQPVRSDWMVPGNTIGFGAHVTVASFDSLRLRLTSGNIWFETTEPEGRVTAGKWTDVLGLVNLDGHCIRGPWKREGQSLRVLGGSFSRVLIPVRPLGSYELKATLTRVADTPEVNVFLPVGAELCMFSIERDEHQLLQSVSADPPPIVNAKPKTDEKISIVAKVRVEGSDAEIAIEVDGKPSVSWHGPQSAVACRSDWLLHPPSLGIGAHDGEAVFHDVELRVLSGDAPILVKRSKTPDDGRQNGRSERKGPETADGTWVRLVNVKSGLCAGLEPGDRGDTIH
jgi:hypothetical protein